MKNNLQNTTSSNCKEPLPGTTTQSKCLYDEELDGTLISGRKQANCFYEPVEDFNLPGGIIASDLDRNRASLGSNGLNALSTNDTKNQEGVDNDIASKTDFGNPNLPEISIKKEEISGNGLERCQIKDQTNSSQTSSSFIKNEKEYSEAIIQKFKVCHQLNCSNKTPSQKLSTTAKRIRLLKQNSWKSSDSIRKVGSEGSDKYSQAEDQSKSKYNEERRPFASIAFDSNTDAPENLFSSKTLTSKLQTRRRSNFS